MTPLFIVVLVLLSLWGVAVLGVGIVLIVETARRIGRRTGNPLVEIARLYRLAARGRLATRADGEERK